ncbi:MAG: hypothetical protein A2Y12_00390 [Planctomycetes bacterium GWF2_42_9]|nr:MAG: hypothetical protein A2Y12_00390 [Planctomycetes bacterium GWF2_42_9]
MKFKRYRVAASCFEPDLNHTIDKRRELLRIHVIELLKEQSPDLLVLPETTIVPDFDKHNFCASESISGPTVQMASGISKDFSTNICVSIIENDNGRLYNSTIYVNRSGSVAGKYRKAVPTSAERNLGIRPGEALQQPIVLDGMRIGTAICFDCNYQDLLWNYISAGIDLMVFPSYTYGGKLMEFWAFSSGVPLICAFPWESIIYDRDGNILIQAGTRTSTVEFGFHPRWIACTLNLESRIYHLDGNQLILKELFARYGGKIDVKLMEHDGRMMITVVSEDIDIDQLEQEIHILPLQKYLRESRIC